MFVAEMDYFGVPTYYLGLHLLADKESIFFCKIFLHLIW